MHHYKYLQIDQPWLYS